MSQPKYYGLNELREMFLHFFETKDHLRLPSFSLIPQNDASLLLINSGMAPMKPFFTGEQEPPRHRVTTCQKCIRTGDIENIGHTARHGTYFEMLGNFSFGDYFKTEAIHWAWEFLTSPEWVGLDPNRLYPSVFAGNETTPADDEAFRIWHEEIGIPEDRIFKFGKEDNFWEHGSGPCGPCSEIYYDRGEKYGCGKPGCTVGCDCDRYMEVWNVVFSQFDNDGHDHYTELKQKNIDTGMGLERLACVMQGVGNLFEVDTVQSVLHHVEHIAGKTYGENAKDDISIRVITDHIRSCTFMVSDGILPSNEGRGYVLRRLLRRAARHGQGQVWPCAVHPDELHHRLPAQEYRRLRHGQERHWRAGQEPGRRVCPFRRHGQLRRSQHDGNELPEGHARSHRAGRGGGKPHGPQRNARGRCARHGVPALRRGRLHHRRNAAGHGRFGHCLIQHSGWHASARMPPSSTLSTQTLICACRC